MKSNILLKKILQSCKMTIVILLFLCISNTTFSQVQVPFSPRKSSKATAPYTNVNNYLLQGDFIMLGNTNMTLQNYADNKDDGSNNMIFVDKDGDSNTVNSSSADLVFPNPACAEIIYAGLYWTGRANNGGNATMTIDGRRKDQIKFKKQGGAYQLITASQLSGNSEIHYPVSSYYQMYAAYADVTDIVKANGAGTYFAADMALKEGNADGIGYYGGWGMVVVFKDISLPWRNITVYDGYAYVVNGTDKYDLPLSGFTAVQNGNVRATIGMMAGEGDRNITGDYFWARKNTGTNDNTNSNWVPLSHSTNSTTNFFNSSINVGGTTRNPSLVNNTGIDIAKFDLPNTGNTIIGNNQTTTKFRYGSTGDTYIIHSIVFGVDAYVPTVIGENTANNVSGVTAVTNGGTINPGDTYSLKVEMKNKGTEPVNNTKVTIPIPYNHYYVSSSITQVASDFPNNTTVTWVPPAGAPSGATPATQPGGSLVWNIGTLPLHSNTNDILGRLSYNLKVATDCTLLLTNSCSINPKINGSITGVGSISGVGVNTGFVTGYGTQACPGPVYGDFSLNINTSSLNCLPSVYDGIKHYQTSNSTFPRTSVVGDYPLGTKFFSTPPTGYGSTTNVVTGDFPVPNASPAVSTYYAVSPGMPDGCYLTLTISRTVCYDTAIPIGLGPDTEVGITSLKHASSTAWPMNRSSGFIAIESKTKGFVITRVSNPVTAITYPQEGMMIFNTTTNKLQIYSDNQWRNFTQAGCP